MSTTPDVGKVTGTSTVYLLSNSNVLDHNLTTSLNLTTEQLHNQEDLSLEAKIVISILLAAMTIGCVLGNSLVILAVLQVHKLRTASNYLIVSLALSDWLVGIIVMPLSLVDTVLGRWPLNKNMCSMFVTFDVMLCTASILNLMMISIDRYLVITRPFKYSQRRTGRLMALYIAIAWSTSLLISVTPMMVGWNVLYEEGVCRVNQDIGYQIYATLGAFYLPLTVMIILYGRIFFISNAIAKAEAKNNPSVLTENIGLDSNVSTKSLPSMELLPCKPAHCHNHNYVAIKTDLDDSGLQLSDENLAVENGLLVVPSADKTVSLSAPELCSLTTNIHEAKIKSTNQQGKASWPSMKKFSVATVSTMKRFLHKKKTNKSSQAIKTLGVIMGLFTACWLPFFILAVVSPICGCSVPKWVYGLLTWLGYVNSCFNPLIYARFNREFRTPFKEILLFHCHTINESVRKTDYEYQYGT